MRKSLTRSLISLLLALFAFGAVGCGSYTRVVVVEKPHVKGKLNQKQLAAADRHFHQGMKFYNKGKFKKAINHFDRAVLKNPQHWEAQYYLGVSHREVRSYRLAHQRLQLALDNCPRDKRIKSRIHAAFGITWEVIGEKNKALDSFTLALNLDHRNDEANEGLARINHKSSKNKNKGKSKKKSHGKNG